MARSGRSAGARTPRSGRSQRPLRGERAEAGAVCDPKAGGDAQAFQPPSQPPRRPDSTGSEVREGVGAVRDRSTTLQVGASRPTPLAGATPPRRCTPAAPDDLPLAALTRVAGYALPLEDLAKPLSDGAAPGEAAMAVLHNDALTFHSEMRPHLGCRKWSAGPSRPSTLPSEKEVKRKVAPHLYATRSRTRHEVEVSSAPKHRDAGSDADSGSLSGSLPKSPSRPLRRRDRTAMSAPVG